MIRVVVLLSLALALAAPAAAQTATVSGTVVDQTAAKISGATVQLTGATNAVTTSGSGGTYTFRNVEPGTYTIEVRLAGFAPAERANITVSTTNVEDV